MTEEERKQEFTALFEYLVYAQELDDFGMRVAVVKILARMETLLMDWEVKEERTPEKRRPSCDT